MKMKRYHWGEPTGEVEEVSAEDFAQMEQLGGNDLLGMDIAAEDKGKPMYAYPDDIDRDSDGTGVKNSYVKEG